MPYPQLRAVVEQWVELTEAHWQRLATIFQPREIQEQTYLL